MTIRPEYHWKLIQIIIRSIKVFIVEDDHRGEVNDIVLGLGAYNVDKEAGDGMRWVISDYPDRGGVITPHDELTVYSNWGLHLYF